MKMMSFRLHARQEGQGLNESLEGQLARMFGCSTLRHLIQVTASRELGLCCFEQ